MIFYFKVLIYLNQNQIIVHILKKLFLSLIFKIHYPNFIYCLISNKFRYFNFDNKNNIILINYNNF